MGFTDSSAAQSHSTDMHLKGYASDLMYVHIPSKRTTVHVHLSYHTDLATTDLYEGQLTDNLLKF